MKKYAFAFAVLMIGLLLANQSSFAWRQEKGRVPAYYKDLKDVKEIPKTLSPDKFEDAETKAAYQVAQENPKLLLQLPCYCFCDDGMNHKSLLSCYETEHAAHCDICRKEAIDANRLQKEKNWTPAEIREKLVQNNGHLSQLVDSASPSLHTEAGHHNTSVNAAPAFKLKSLQGKTLSLDNYKGKIVVINFWASWCVPCQKEMPELVKLQKKYAAQGLQILGVTYEAEKPAVVRRIAQKYKINYPLLFGSEELAKQYHVEEALPTTVIVDREGKIQSQILGMIDTKDVEEKIAPLLAANNK